MTSPDAFSRSLNERFGDFLLMLREYPPLRWLDHLHVSNMGPHPFLRQVRIPRRQSADDLQVLLKGFARATRQNHRTMAHHLNSIPERFHQLRKMMITTRGNHRFVKLTVNIEIPCVVVTNGLF